MTDKELQRLSRCQLLELMLDQSRRIDKLELELSKAQEQLRKRQIAVKEAGSIAEAALQLSGIFEAAQQAADMYLDNISERPAQDKPERSRQTAERQAKNAPASDIPARPAQNKPERSRQTAERQAKNAPVFDVPAAAVQKRNASELPPEEDGMDLESILQYAKREIMDFDF